MEAVLVMPPPPILRRKLMTGLAVVVGEVVSGDLLVAGGINAAKLVGRTSFLVGAANEGCVMTVGSIGGESIEPEASAAAIDEESAARSEVTPSEISWRIRSSS